MPLVDFILMYKESMQLLSNVNNLLLDCYLRHLEEDDE
jgi:hypothetical protein